MKNPWERETGLEIPPSTFLLNPDFPIRLSEFDIRPESEWQYFFGELLTCIHRQNYRYTDFHQGNAGLDPRNGEFLIIDPGGLVDTKLNPREMVADLLIPYQTLSREDFNAFLAGYIRRAYIDLDLKYDGYTRELLNYVGGQVISSLDQGSLVLDFAEILRQLHLNIGNNLSLSFDGELDPSRLDYTRFDDYLLVIFMLYVSGARTQVLFEVKKFLLTHLPPYDSIVQQHGVAFAKLFEYIRFQDNPEPGSRPEGCVVDNIVSWLITKSFSQFVEFRKYVSLGSGDWQPN